MMAMRHYVVTQGREGMKAVSIDRLPEEAWRTMGVTTAGVAGDVLRLYEETAWLRAGVDIRCNAVAALPFAFERANGDSLADGDVPDFPFALDMDEMLNTIEGHLALFGAAYLFKGTNAAGIVRELRTMHPESVRPQLDEARGLVGFERRAGKWLQTLGVEDVAYVWLPSRRGDIGPGVSPARAALKAAGLLGSADEFGATYFANGVIAPTLITVPGGTPESERARLQSWVERATRGVKKAFNALAVGSEITVSPLGAALELGKLALPELTDKKREDIATALGVPQSVLFSSAANYATAEVDDRHFYTKTVIPSARRIERALNRQVFAALGWRLRFKPERLEVFERLESEKALALRALVEAGIYTVAEAREALGK